MLAAVPVQFLPTADFKLGKQKGKIEIHG